MLVKQMGPNCKFHLVPTANGAQLQALALVAFSGM